MTTTATATLAKPKTFVAWDGEGLSVGDGEAQPYVLLLSSAGDELFDRGGKTLSTRDCLGTLWAAYERDCKATFVIFGGTYDCYQFFATASNVALKRIHRAGNLEPDLDDYSAFARSFTRIRGTPFLVRYIPRKALFVRHLRKRGRLVLYDVFGFYQSTFVRALEANLPDYPETKSIAAMKKQRATFSIEQFDEVKAYCAREVDALAQLATKLESDLREAGIAGLREWSGAGSLAQYVLRCEKVDAHIGELPKQIERAAYHAYSGGRIELWQLGDFQGRIYEHDLISAYPSAMLALPSLNDAHAGWRRLSHDGISCAFALLKVRWRFERSGGARAFPFFYREGNDAIKYPRAGEGWFWSCEVDGARACLDLGLLNGKIEILEGWELVDDSGGEAKPFGFVKELFARRRAMLAVQKRGGAENVLKLALNSIYGKLCQNRGRRRFFSIAWAGYITALTRAKMYRLAMTDPEAVVAIATDAVYSTRPLPCDIGTDLGQYEVSEYERGMFVQPGVSFLWKDGKRVDRYRGFDRRTLDPDVIRDAWARHKLIIKATVHRFTTLGTAIAGRMDRKEQIARLVEAEAHRTWYEPEKLPQGVTPDWFCVQGRWKISGEWADVPRRLLDLSNRPYNRSYNEDRVWGNADDVATQYGMNSDELRAWLARPVKTFHAHRSALEEKLRPQFELLTDGELRDLSPPVFRSWRDLPRTLDIWAQRGKRLLPGPILGFHPERGLVPLVPADALCPDLISKESPKMAVGQHDDDDVADLEEEIF